MRIGSAAALVTAMMLSGCGQPDYVTDSRASVLLIVDDVNGGAAYDSDVRLGEESNLVCADSVQVTASVRAKNPTIVAGSSGDVRVTGYQVSYHRSDGRSQQGVDVPYTITGAISTLVTAGGSTEFPIDVVRIQAKLEPPLNNFEAGSRELTLFAEITLTGQTVSGDGVSATGSLQIDFANYVDENESCPTEG